MDSKIFGALGLFFGVGIILMFGLAFLGGTTEELNGTIPADMLPTYNTTVQTIETSTAISAYLPYLLILIPILMALIGLGAIKIRG